MYQPFPTVQWGYTDIEADKYNVQKTIIFPVSFASEVYSVCTGQLWDNTGNYTANLYIKSVSKI